MSSGGTLLDWLTFGAAGVSALFAGLVWWQAVRGVRIRLLVDAVRPDGKAALKLEVDNQSSSDFVVERLSVSDPTKVVIDAKNGMPTIKPLTEIGDSTTASDVVYEWRVEPGAKTGRHLLLWREDGFRSLKTVSVVLHVQHRFPWVHRRSRTATGVLPAEVREARA